MKLTENVLCAALSMLKYFKLRAPLAREIYILEEKDVGLAGKFRGKEDLEGQVTTSSGN